jgi:hypothetical protein
VPACARVHALAARAQSEGASLVAYARPEPIVARGDQTLWPGRWYHDTLAHKLTPTTAGHAIAHIAVASDQRYELWLGGSFTRGFEITVDGRYAGGVEDMLSAINGYARVADMRLAPGVHTFRLTYPGPSLAPGSAESDLTTLSAITLVPAESPQRRLIAVAPQNAQSLCGHSLDWIELVRGA